MKYEKDTSKRNTIKSNVSCVFFFTLNRFQIVSTPDNIFVHLNVAVYQLHCYTVHFMAYSPYFFSLVQ